MTDDLQTVLARLKGAWTMGAPTPSGIPDAWQPYLAGDQDSQNLAALAIAGQALQVGFIPSPPTALTARADLPVLDFPTLPEAGRSSFRMALNALKSASQPPEGLIWLIAARGYSVHPIDWMPPISADLPDVYAPWLDWLKKADVVKSPDDILSADNWDRWAPGERVTVLKELRKEDPVAALSLIEAKAPNEPADKRLALVKLLWIGLSDTDTPFLESLQKDRSGKVVAGANQLLARLGRVSVDQEELQELADFIEHATTGILNRRQIVKAKTLKTSAQRARLSTLLGTLPLEALARKFSLSQTEFLSLWEINPKQIEATDGLIQMTAQTGSRDAIELLASKLPPDINLKPHARAALYDRLSEEDRLKHVSAVLDASEASIHSLPLLLGNCFGRLSLSMSSASIRALLASIRNSLSEDQTKRRQTLNNKVMLATLGMSLTREDAEQLVSACLNAGLSSADPELSILRFNAALEKRA